MWPLHDKKGMNHGFFKNGHHLCISAVPDQTFSLFHSTRHSCSMPIVYTNPPKILTNIQTPLFGSVLSGVPVLPVFQLIISALFLSEHHHHNTLEIDSDKFIYFDNDIPVRRSVFSFRFVFFLTLTLVMGCCRPLLSTSLRVMG